MKKKKTVKAWAVISPDNTLPMWGNHQILIYNSREKARIGKYDAYADNGRVIPCTITYTP